LPQQSEPRTGAFPRPFPEDFFSGRREGVTEGNGNAQIEIPALNSVALRSLACLYNEEEKLFCHSIALTESGLRREGTSLKGTVIALLGLQHLAESGSVLTIDIAPIREFILEETSWVKSVGDLGLLTWYTAVCAPERVAALLRKFDCRKAIESDSRRAETRGLSWFLAGLAHARLACARLLPELTDIAVETYHLLQDLQSENGIFGHGGPQGFVGQIFRNRYGTFADQIHAIYALSTFAQAFEIEEPLEMALNCANAMCAQQGELGQWWFRYDRRRGCVASHYPVCSAHQDGMAPMALLALGEATGQNFQEQIWKGLKWIAAQNELSADLRSPNQAMIWDSIEPRRRAAEYWETACNYLHVSSEPQAKNLKIRYEARPQHFGWLLYAFGKMGISNARLAFAQRAG
jgi:hypothetical protein